MHHILIIDDDNSVRDALEFFFKEKGFKTTTAPDGLKGLKLLKEERFDVFMVDLMMPDISGLDVIKEASAQHITTPGIVITGHGTIKNAVEAMKLGAFDYITKPFIFDELLIAIDRAIELSNLQKENILLKKQLKRKYNFDVLIGDCPQMQEVYEQVEKIADTDSTLLLTGESGTGKELIAKIVHFNSFHCQKPFVPINCAAIPRDLLESELFGFEKGAFTGAINTKIGRFELAHEGTLFLDEIGELDLSLQAKLLRVLEEKEFVRVGGVKTIKVDTRIIVATNKDLEKAIKEGKFREDLFYRLNVIPIHLPPLRERIEDISLFVNHFVHKFAKDKKKKPLKFEPAAMKCLMKYHWPGNIRELENLIERLTILVSNDTVKVSDLPEKFYNLFDLQDCRPDNFHNISNEFNLPESGISLNKFLEDAEKNLIFKAMEKTGGIKSKTAKLLGLKRTTLIEKLKKINLQ
ncbi:MAG: sigma-54 dependent transcriptional regulator [Nitrospirota bacterium]